MSTESPLLRAAVSAELPWRDESSLRGTLRLDGEALVLDAVTGRRVAIPLGAIQRAGIETTLGVLPALQVWHTVDGQQVRSRFEFLGEQATEDDERAPDLGLADRVGPGLARDAAERLEGGLRALSGGLKGGKRAMRQVVEGVARQEEYRQWPAAIAQAQEAQRRRSSTTRTPTTPASAAPPPPAPPPAPLVPERSEPPAGDARARYEWFRRDVLRWIAACGARARELSVPGAPVIQSAYPLDSRMCHIVVAGEFSRGKSTLINALFGIHGEIALPTGMTPTTALACAIRVPNVGETDGATITYRTARPPLQLSLDAFRAGVRLAEEGGTRQTTDEGTPLHLDEARRVEVRITGAYLPAGVEIEDTPGLNEQANRSTAALAAIGRADLILFVLAADQLLSDLEQEVIGRTLLEGHHRNVLFLVNFWDSIDDPAQRAILRQRVGTLLGAVNSPFTAQHHPAPGGEHAPPVFYVSALQAARAQRKRTLAPEESGIPALRAFLRELLGPRSAALLLRARAGRALRYVDLLQQAVSRAGAASALGGVPGGQARTPQDALAAATRLLDGLPAAVAEAVAPLLTEARSGGAPGLARVAPLIARASAEGHAQALQEARRALAAEQRARQGACGQAAQGAIDLVLAQVRATFLARGLPAPQLATHLDLPVPALPEQATAADLWASFDGLADALQAACRAGAERLRQRALDDARAQLSAPSPAAAAPERPAGLEEAERRRLAALRALEEDLLRLRGALRRCLDA